MKLFVNKFFIIISMFILVLFSIQFYFVSNSYKRDTNSYVILLEWRWSLNNWSKNILLNLNKKEKLSSWDIVITLNKSLAIIEWWDKSITRLWENSKIKVNKNYVWEDLSLINIDFELLWWKTWSNVVSIFASGSYFKQETKWTIAAVRWTVFEVNYDNDYIYVQKHEVNLTKSSWEIKNLPEWEASSIVNFSLKNTLIKLDKTFQELNQKLDKDYINQLRKDFIANIKSKTFLYINKNFDSKSKIYYMLLNWSSKNEIDNYINTLDDKDKKEVLSYLNTFNQVLNFENWDDNYLYNIKLLTRDILVKNIKDDKYKQLLLKYSLYDLSDLKNDLKDKTTMFLKENKSHLLELKEINIWELNLLNKLLDIDKLPVNSSNLIDKFKDVEHKWNDLINKWLDSLFNIKK